MSSTIDPGALARLRDVVGDKGWLDDAQAMSPYLVDARGLYRGQVPAVPPVLRR